MLNTHNPSEHLTRALIWLDAFQNPNKAVEEIANYIKASQERDK